MEELAKPSQANRDILDLLFLLREPKGLFSPFEPWVGKDDPISTIVEAFRANLNSAANVGCVPFRLAAAGVYNRRFFHIAQIERLVFFRDNLDYPKEEAETIILKNAHEEMKKEQKSEEYVASYSTEIANFLAQSARDPDMKSASHELLRQVAVIIWGSLEVIATDVAIEILNKRPNIVNDVLTSEIFKRLGISKNIPVERLQEYNFDVSSSIGTILFEDRRLDSLPAIAGVCEALWKDDALNIKLKSNNVWLLSQRRHLIVHRRGIVDARYLEKTSDSLPLGEHLVIRPADIRQYLVEIRDIGLLIASLASEALGRVTA